MQLKGNSGYKLSTTTLNGTKMIMKSSDGDNEKTRRLYNQAHKQAMAPNEHHFLKPIKIHAWHHAKNGFYFKMEYIKGKNPLKLNEKQLKTATLLILEYLRDNVRRCPIEAVKPDIFQSKIEQVKQAIHDNKSLYRLRPALAPAVRKLELAFQTSLYLPLGYCHGDLTTTNMIAAQNRNNPNAPLIYTFDYLDNFIDTPLQDIVKLRQDTNLYWARIFDKTITMRNARLMDSMLVETFKRWDWYNEYYKRFQALNIMRILPYARTPEVMQFCSKEFLKCMS